MSAPDSNPNSDLAANGLALTVRLVERRLRWILVAIAAFIVLVLVVGGFSVVSVVVAGVAAVFLVAAFLALRAFASIGRSP